jgi:hypothetical protein
VVGEHAAQAFIAGAPPLARTGERTTYGLIDGDGVT